MYLLIINKPIECKLRFVNRISTILCQMPLTRLFNEEKEKKKQNCMLAINVSTFARRDKIIPACRSLNNIARIFFILIIYDR